MRPHPALPRRRLFAVVALCLLPISVFAFVAEIEPNNTYDSPNLVQCGDTVLCAALAPGDVDHFRVLGVGGDSLYFRTFNCSGSQTNTFLTLFDDAFQLIAVDDESGPGAFSVIGIWVPHTAYYTIRVLGIDTETDSTYNLLIDCVQGTAEPFDECETARIVPSLPYYDEGSTLGMSHDVGTPAPDVFYKFTQPILSDVHIEVCSEFWDARVQILLYCIGGYHDDENVGCLNGATLTTYGLAPGEYYVIVEGTSALEFGEYSIEIAPAFPECPAPRDVILFDVGGLPALDWPDAPGADYYVVFQSPLADGPFEHLDTTHISFYQDAAGYAADTRFYQIKTVCPWGD